MTAKKTREDAPDEQAAIDSAETGEGPSESTENTEEAIEITADSSVAEIEVALSAIIGQQVFVRLEDPDAAAREALRQAEAAEAQLEEVRRAAQEADDRDGQARAQMAQEILDLKATIRELQGKIPGLNASNDPVEPRKLNRNTNTVWCGACDNSQPTTYPRCLKCGTPVLFPADYNKPA